MAQTYKVRVMDEYEWEALVKSNPRFEHVDASNLGFADRATKTGYVRRDFLQQFPGMKPYLLQHEFDHLVDEKPTDVDEHGICHKKFFKQILAPVVAPYISPFIQKGFTGEALRDVGRNLAGTVGGFLTGGPVGAVTGTVAQSLRNAANPTGSPLTGRSALGAGVTGAAGGAAGAGIGNLFGLGGTGATTSGLSTLATRFNPGTGAASIPSTSPFSTGSNIVSRFRSGGARGSTPGSMFQLTGLPGGRVFTGTPEAAQRLLPYAFGQSPSAASSATPALMNRLLLGGLATGVGAGLAQYGARAPQGQPPEVPELAQTPAIQQFRTDVTNQLNPLTQQFAGLATRAGGLSQTPLPAAIETPIRRQFDLLRRNLHAQTALFRPGADIATDSEYRRQVEDINQREAESIANAQFAFQGNERQNIEAQRFALTSQLGVSEDELNAFAAIAQLDLETIRMRLGLSAEQAIQFKNLFGTLGSTVAGAGIMGAFGR